MGSTNNIERRINEKYKNMSRGQKLLASYITDNYDKAAFYTAQKLGETVGVSESTVIRFASGLGYKGYPEFQKELEELVQGKLSQTSPPRTVGSTASQSEILEKVVRADIENLKQTLEHIDSSTFELAVDIILNAKDIYVIGIRSCAPLAAFLSFYLNLMFRHVRLLSTNSPSELFEQMIRIGNQDVVIGISFPRYSMRTLKALEFANHRNAKVITLTDSVHSPLNLYSSCNLLAKSSLTPIADSLTAPLCVINALITSLYAKRRKETAETLQTLDKVWNEYQIYENDEIDSVDDSVWMYYGDKTK